MIYNITPNDKLDGKLNKALESKADKSDLEEKWLTCYGLP